MTIKLTRADAAALNLGVDFAAAVTQHSRALAKWQKNPTRMNELHRLEHLPRPEAAHPLIERAATEGFEIVSDAPAATAADQPAPSAPIEIPLSEIKQAGLEPEQFAAEVETFKGVLAEHRARPADWDPAPAPVAAHPAIAAAAIAGDHRLVDDVTPSLEERKTALAQQVEALEQAAIEKVFPRLARRLMHYNHQRALAVPSAQRTEAQRAVIEDRRVRQEKLEAIDHHAALLLAQIQTLTEATIDGFEPRPFPGA